MEREPSSTWLATDTSGSHQAHYKCTGTFQLDWRLPSLSSYPTPVSLLAWLNNRHSSWTLDLWQRYFFGLHFFSNKQSLFDKFEREKVLKRQARKWKEPWSYIFRASLCTQQSQEQKRRNDNVVDGGRSAWSSVSPTVSHSHLGRCVSEFPGRLQAVRSEPKDVFIYLAISRTVFKMCIQYEEHQPLAPRNVSRAMDPRLSYSSQDILKVTVLFM